MRPVSLDVSALFQRYGPMVHRRCAHLLRDEAEADDATQEVFVRLWTGRDRLVEDKPVSLLWTMATNVCLNKLRSRRRKPQDPVELLDRIAAVDDGVGQSPIRQALERIFADEPKSTRVMAVLHHVDGLTLEETAQEMGMSVSGVRKRLRVLKAKLADSPERDALPEVAT